MFSSVVEMRAPEQPRGWPRAMAPPFRLTFSSILAWAFIIFACALPSVLARTLALARISYRPVVRRNIPLKMLRKFMSHRC